MYRHASFCSQCSRLLSIYERLRHYRQTGVEVSNCRRLKIQMAFYWPEMCAFPSCVMCREELLLTVSSVFELCRHFHPCWYMLRMYDFQVWNINVAEWKLHEAKCRFLSCPFQKCWKRSVCMDKTFPENPRRIGTETRSQNHDKSSSACLDHLSFVRVLATLLPTLSSNCLVL